MMILKKVIMKPASIKIFTALISLVLVFSAGCNTTSPTTTTTTQLPDATTAPASTTVLNMAGSEPYTLDPALAGESGSVLFINQIFTGLVKTSDTGILPDIATSWDISADGKTYTFHLRNDVFFQDGRRLTAKDFKYSWERACNPATGSSTAATYLGDITGAADMLSGNASSLSGVTVVNDFTLQVSLVKAVSYFVYKLAYVTAFAVDEQNVKSGANWWQMPNGTGPFKLGSWVSGTSITLAQNRIYYGGAVKLGSAVFQFLSGRPIDLYTTSQIDVAGVGADDLDRASDPNGEFVAQLQVFPELSLFYIGFNIEAAPFDDPLVRQAFSMAIDRDKVVSLAYNNSVASAAGILPPGIPGYDTTLKGIGFDPEQAKLLIAQSKYGSIANLPQITITTSGYGGLIDAGLTAIINQWQINLGVTVNVRQLDPSIYFYQLKQEKDQLYYSGWIADYPSPQDFLDLLFRSGADFNYGGYSNPAVDALLDQAAAATDAAASLNLYKQAQQLIVNDAAILPFFFGQEDILIKPYVTGFKVNVMGLPVLDQVVVGNH
ncbi:oligopeptide ABC transporter OppA [Dehalogenimonas sp. WBC-2]|nr:oligopeptide ABC transporter OppA [Dehalogenimonas sp. WBC-2]